MCDNPYAMPPTNDGGYVMTDEEAEADAEESDTVPIPCCKCGRPTTWDPTYNDLCYRCIRADNE